jgi:ribosomal protein L40E
MTLTDLQDLIRPLLPEPCSTEQGEDNSVTLTGGAPGEVIVRIAATTVEVLAYTVEWDGPHTPVTTGVPVATVDLVESDLVATVSDAIGKARTARLATYRTCTRCNETNPPEWMHDAQTCQRCAERDFGVVY